MTGEVTDMEARVIARLQGADAGAILRGTIRGPYCENTRTLPAELHFRPLAKNVSQVGGAEAVAMVPDPCLWSADLPHVYQIDLEAVCDNRIIAEYHGTIGLRRLAPRLPVDFAPGTG